MSSPCLLGWGHCFLIGGGDKNVRVMETSENRYTVISVDDLMVALLRMSPVVLMKVFKVKEIKFDS